MKSTSLGLLFVLLFASGSTVAADRATDPAACRQEVAALRSRYRALGGRAAAAKARWFGDFGQVRMERPARAPVAPLSQSLKEDDLRGLLKEMFPEQVRLGVLDDKMRLVGRISRTLFGDRAQKPYVEYCFAEDPDSRQRLLGGSSCVKIFSMESVPVIVSGKPVQIKIIDSVWQRFVGPMPSAEFAPMEESEFIARELEKTDLYCPGQMGVALKNGNSDVFDDSPEQVVERTPKAVTTLDETAATGAAIRLGTKLSI